MKKLIPVLLFSALLFSCTSNKKIESAISTENWKTNYTYVFVHGLSGWGHYDARNKFFPYWGMDTGSLMKYLNKQGFDVHDASVAPQGSAWDRVCELYAQLTGQVTDYGLEHSTRCGHPRYGKDFSKQPLIKEWDSQHKINLLGHSFGGVTVRLLAHLMENGAQAEIDATPVDQLSGLFTGGHKDWIYSVTTLAAPHNGTSAYHIPDPEPQKKSFMQKMMDKENNKKTDNRISYDVAGFDMHIDNAQEINKWLSTLDSAYYFSFAANATILQPDGNYLPDTDKMEKLFQKKSELMGTFQGVTYDGIELGADWKMNDGLVNTCSALAPSSAPSTHYDPDNIEPGIWNIMPIYSGDHMCFQGGLTVKNDVREFYLLHLNMINGL